MGTATAKLYDAHVSDKRSVVLLDRIRNRNVGYAKDFLGKLLDEKMSIDGKHYTKTAKVILGFIESAEANARQKNLDTEKLFIKMITADKGERSFRGRSRWRLRGRKSKSTNLKLVLEER